MVKKSFRVGPATVVVPCRSDLSFRSQGGFRKRGRLPKCRFGMERKRCDEPCMDTPYSWFWCFPLWAIPEGAHRRGMENRMKRLPLSFGLHGGAFGSPTYGRMRGMTHALRGGTKTPSPPRRRTPHPSFSRKRPPVTEARPPRAIMALFTDCFMNDVGSVPARRHVPRGRVAARLPFPPPEGVPLSGTPRARGRL